MNQPSCSIVPASIWRSRLNYLVILASGLCLVTVFYASGTIHKLLTSSPSPGEQRSAGASLYSGNGMARTTGVTSVTDVVTKALAFRSMLTTAQQSVLEQTYTATLARKWSNLPCGAGCRNGIQFGSLTSAQFTAAMEVIQAALGTGANDGYDEFDKNRLAEAYLHANGGGSGYDSTLRWICFLNTPSVTGAWMLQFGGHHYAANIAFNNGHVIGATPFFQGLEPKSFTWNNAAYAPLDDEKNAFAAMLASLSSTDLNTARLSQSFSDCVMIPGETNGGVSTFPAYNMGISCGSLSATQKNLVLAAVAHYVQDMDAATAAAVTATYTADIDNTYISWRGTGTAGTASSFLTANGDYVRISGPQVWIEFTCQNGVVIQGQIHYHTVWRDRAHDYGVDLAGPAIDGASSGIAVVKTSHAVPVYPNPATGQVSITLDNTITGGNMTIISAVSGQIVQLQKNVTGNTFRADVAALPAGMYILKLENDKAIYSGKFLKQ